MGAQCQRDLPTLVSTRKLLRVKEMWRGRVPGQRPVVRVEGFQSPEGATAVIQQSGVETTSRKREPPKKTTKRAESLTSRIHRLHLLPSSRLFLAVRVDSRPSPTPGRRIRAVRREMSARRPWAGLPPLRRPRSLLLGQQAVARSHQPAPSDGPAPRK